MQTIQERLVIIRSGQSRRAFAERLGVTEGTIRNYEKGISSPNAEFLEKIYKLLRIEPKWLLTGESPMRPDEGPPSFVTDTYEVVMRDTQEQMYALQAQLRAANEEIRQLELDLSMARGEALQAKNELADAYKQAFEALREMSAKAGGFTTDVPASAPNAPLISLRSEE